jgi:DNA-binding LacI/PurR family transcriptional regulator
LTNTAVRFSRIPQKAIMLEVIRDNIERNVYTAGKRLPSERKLAEEFHVPQSQVRKALRTLVEEGYLNCQRNNGYFVKESCPQSTRLYRIAYCQEQELCIVPSEYYYTGMLFTWAGKYNLNFTTRQLPNDIQEQNRFFHELAEENYDGLLVFPQNIKETFSALWEIKRRKIPLIFWDYSPLHGVFPAVGVDHFQSCFTAVEVLSRCKLPVRFIGYEGNEQSRLKYDGFIAGSQMFGVKNSEPIFIPYSTHATGETIREQISNLETEELIFASTRKITENVVSLMMERGLWPGRDYFLLGTDKIALMEGCSLMLDCMKRDREGIALNLLSMMRNMIEQPDFAFTEIKLPMKYLRGDTLKK